MEYLLGLLIILVILVVIVIYFLNERKKLTEEEKKVVDLIAKNKGEMKQTKLRKELGLNQQKFNKLLRSLEEKSFVKRIPRGRENVVRLLLW